MNGGGFILRYTGKHLYRAAGKSALAALLAALLLCAIGQIASMRQSYGDVFRDTVIKARFPGLKLTAVRRIIDSGYTSDVYYEARGTAGVDLDFFRYPNLRIVDLVFTNNISRYTGEEAEIRFAEGYDESCLYRFNEILIAGKAYFERRGLSLGSRVAVGRPSLFVSAIKPYIEQFALSEGGETESDDEGDANSSVNGSANSSANNSSTGDANSDAAGAFLRAYGAQIMRELSTQVKYFTVAGVVSTPSGEYDTTLFSPGIYAPSSIGMPDETDLAECTLADNNCIDEFRAGIRDMLGLGATDAVVMVMDTGRIDNIRNAIRILDALYPVLVSASLLAGGFLCSLSVLQSAKEAATMRALGTPTARVCAILMLVQALPCAAGLAGGTVAMILYQGAALAAAKPVLYLFTAAYFAVILAAAAACSALVTRRSTLELLQTKE